MGFPMKKYIQATDDVRRQMGRFADALSQSSRAIKNLSSKLRDEFLLIDLGNIPNGTAFFHNGQKYIKMTTVEWPGGTFHITCHPAGDFYKRATFSSKTKVKPATDDLNN